MEEVTTSDWQWLNQKLNKYTVEGHEIIMDYNIKCSVENPVNSGLFISSYFIHARVSCSAASACFAAPSGWLSNCFLTHHLSGRSTVLWPGATSTCLTTPTHWWQEKWRSTYGLFPTAWKTCSTPSASQAPTPTKWVAKNYNNNLRSCVIFIYGTKTT